MTETAQIFCDVLNNNFPNGYIFANKADIGGKTGETWVISNATASTSIYNPTPAKLPKTGFSEHLFVGRNKRNW
jgi:hypothetical protein